MKFYDQSNSHIVRVLSLLYSGALLLLVLTIKNKMHFYDSFTCFATVVRVNANTNAYNTETINIIEKILQIFKNDKNLIYYKARW